MSAVGVVVMVLQNQDRSDDRQTHDHHGGGEVLSWDTETVGGDHLRNDAARQRKSGRLTDTQRPTYAVLLPVVGSVNLSSSLDTQTHVISLFFFLLQKAKPVPFYLNCVVKWWKCDGADGLTYERDGVGRRRHDLSHQQHEDGQREQHCDSCTETTARVNPHGQTTASSTTFGPNDGPFGFTHRRTSLHYNASRSFDRFWML